MSIRPLLALLPLALLGLAGCERPPMESQQTGYRSTGMVQISNPRLEAEKVPANIAPQPTPQAPAAGPKAGDVYQNVQVLGDLSVGQFVRLMQAMTEWVAPEAGCTYCHVGNNFADDGIYTKIVSRRMVQMTQHINEQWQPHVGATGATCYTCHRGQPVPAGIWFRNPGPPGARGLVGNRASQNFAAESVGLASLPYDPFTPFLEEARPIRAVAKTTLPQGSPGNIKATEWTYALMMHMSQSLGVNCTYCHNSRSFMSWDQSSPARVTAWYGIEMVKALNRDYLTPLYDQYPEHRLGPLGDAPKANCITCHQGVRKPLYGAPLAQYYPGLLKAAAPASTTTTTDNDGRGAP